MPTTSLKTAGIIRRIDEFGRVVIPIEIRRMLDILDDDSIEININNEGKIVLQKYSPKGEVVGKSEGHYIHKGAGKNNFLDLVGKIEFADNYDYKALREGRK